MLTHPIRHDLVPHADSATAEICRSPTWKDRPREACSARGRPHRVGSVPSAEPRRLACRGDVDKRRQRHRYPAADGHDRHRVHHGVHSCAEAGRAVVLGASPTRSARLCSARLGAAARPTLTVSPIDATVVTIDAAAIGSTYNPSPDGRKPKSVAPARRAAPHWMTASFRHCGDR